MDDKVEPPVPPRPTKIPRFGRLLWACIFVWFVCGFLTWYAGSYLGQCCDLSLLAKWFR